MAKSRVDKLIDAWEPELRKAFLKSFQDIKDSAQIGQIIARLEAQDVEGAIRAVGIDATKFRPFDKTIVESFEAGGNATMNSFPSVKLTDGFRLKFKFDVRNPSAERWLNERSSTQITHLVSNQVTMVREHLVAGLEAGNNPRSVALDLVGKIGAKIGRAHV